MKQRRLCFLVLFLSLCAGCAQREPPATAPAVPRARRTAEDTTREGAAGSKSARSKPPVDTGLNVMPSATPPRTTRTPPAASFSFETKLHEESKNRMENIRKVSEKLSGAVIEPGSEFSFNRRVGARTAEAGYREAPIVVEGKKEKGVGGGVCQVSSTLYNAALKAGLEVVERHGHTKDVGYVEEGRDATVNYGSLDLKIKNNRSRAFIVACTVSDEAVVVTLTEQI